MDNNTGSTSRTIKFYSEEGVFKEWYADIPEYIAEGGTKEDLQMVAGADMLLDILSDHGKDIVVEFSDVCFNGANVLRKLEDLGEDFICASGAYYYIDNIDGKVYKDTIWLCDVLKWVFGDHPLNIYYKVSTSDKITKAK